MPIPCYLAMTGTEFSNAAQLPDKVAWMACHYSCYGTGLSNLPPQLPEGSLVILNDRTPPCRHDPELIVRQLKALYEAIAPFGFLLDLQRPELQENSIIAKAITEALPCPVAVSDLYAKELSGPVFLPPVPVDMPLSDHINSWEGREIWLEVALQTEVFTLTENGCTVTSDEALPLQEPVFEAPALLCRYHWELHDHTAFFTLQRTKKELDTLLQNAEGVRLAVGLYQQLGQFS